MAEAMEVHHLVNLSSVVLICNYKTCEEHVTPLASSFIVPLCVFFLIEAKIDS